MVAAVNLTTPGYNLNTSGVYNLDGAPVDGPLGTLAGAARPGALLIDNINAALYQNTGTQSSPTWSIILSNPSNIATGQVSVGTSATLIVAARSGRKNVIIVQGGTTNVYLGGSTVTTATGGELVGIEGTGFQIDGAAAVYGVVGSGTQTVSYVETF